MQTKNIATTTTTKKKEKEEEHNKSQRFRCTLSSARARQQQTTNKTITNSIEMLLLFFLTRAFVRTHAPGTCLSAEASARRLVCCAIESIVRRVCTRQSVLRAIQHHTQFIRIVRVSDEREREEEEEVKKKSLSRGERERESRRERVTRQKQRRAGREKREKREEREERDRNFFLSPNRRRTKERVYYPNTHLEVKRTVHAILLRPEDGRQVFRHLGFVSLLFFFCVILDRPRLSSSSLSVARFEMPHFSFFPNDAHATNDEEKEELRSYQTRERRRRRGEKSSSTPTA
jgi:hypothetical protein